MRILVTGARGFIGSWLTHELATAGHHVVARDRAEGDLAEDGVFARMLAANDVDTVVHLAAKYGRLKGEVDPALTVTQNAVVTTRVAQACGEHGVRLVYVSSSEIYGDLGQHLIREGDADAVLPHNIYGLSKKWGEEVARLYAPNRLLILRLNMPYGPGQEGGWGSCALIQMLEAARDRKPLVVHRGAERSWCWVGDTVYGMRLAIERGSGVYNVGRDDDPTLMTEVAGMACGLAGSPFHDVIRVVDPPPRQTVVKRLSSQRLRDLGWTPRVSLDEGMRMTFDAMKEARAA